MGFSARQHGVVAGLDLASIAFRQLDPEIAIVVEKPDGATVALGDIVATAEGSPIRKASCLRRRHR